MDEFNRSILNALESGGPIPRDRVRGWIHQAATVQADASLYKLTREAWSRIEPRLEMAETCTLIERYLLACIRENPQDGVALTRYEAAGELEAWFDRLAQMDDTRDILNQPGSLRSRGDKRIRISRVACEPSFAPHRMTSSPRP